MYKIYPKTLFVGQKIVYLPSCQSTNDEAAQLLTQEDVPEGTIIVTDQQTQGRGQRGNQWEAQAGQNLTISLVLHPNFLAATDQFWLNIAVSLAIQDTLSPLLPTTGLTIKWPNDVYVHDRKLGGVLIENTLQGYVLGHSVVGVGLNVNQTAFGVPTATSLLLESSAPDGYSLPGLLTALAEQLEKRYLQLRAGHRHVLRTTYLQHLYRYQQPHTYLADDQLFTGTITDLDPTGRLGILSDGVMRYFAFKEVTFLQ
ncbi:biotin--[acetyl-CoA-carboxylase] ligase [uncultured Fibrella sp.]|uniref:biotin--[acetyl-CoA-carboxylase] ligase n=1 Tax=uncultured Fibrella sp. TaxID=1284596 RepID=UPI0035CC19E5